MSSDRYSVPPELVNELDALVEDGVFSSRSEALRYGARLVVHEERLATVHREIADAGVELVPLSADVLDAAADLRRNYGRVNVFDAVHLGTATLVDEPVVSTDTLFPDVEAVEHVGPREL